MKALLKDLGFEHLPMLSEFVEKTSDGIFLDIFLSNKLDWVKCGNPKDTHKFACKVRTYQQFITQPLKRGQFVACDEKGNVLNEPNNWKYFDTMCEHTDIDDWILECEEYKKALDRVIFEGWEILIEKQAEEHELSRCDTLMHTSSKESIWYMPNSTDCKFSDGISGFKSIESWINSGGKLTLKK